MNEVDLGAGALLGILAASVIGAVVALLAIRRWSDQQALARAKSSAQAHLLEFRLFLDDPPVLLRSQVALLADNLRIMRLLLKPLLVAALPMVLIFWQLDALYGRAPLRVGEAAIVSTPDRQPELQVPTGIAVETKPLHIQATGETVWRIRPGREMSSILRAGSVQTKVVAGKGVAYLPQPLTGRGPIDIAYPRATVLGWPWLAWFLILSTLAAFLLRRPMKVTF